MTSRQRGLFDLSGRVVVVTGGNRGIGFGMARGLANAGASIAIWARDREQNEKAAAELTALGVEVQTVCCDVSSEEDVIEATRSTVDHFGQIDAGFANAGFGSGGDALEMDLAEWRRITAVNLDGVFLTFRYIGAHMKARGGGGKLVAISSISAIFGAPTQPHYAASKAGVESLVRALAIRMARYDVQVNAIQPGWIATEATAMALQYERFNETIVGRTPARRWGEISDFEGIAVYLASDASRFHTGDTIRVDGGYSIF